HEQAANETHGDLLYAIDERQLGLGGAGHERNGGRQPLPALEFLGEVFLSGTRQRVVLRAPVGLGGVPLGLDVALCLELVQGRIERALLDEQHVAGKLTDALGDRPAVLRLEGDDLEDQQIERALDEVGGSGHMLPLVTNTRYPSWCWLSRGAKQVSCAAPMSNDPTRPGGTDETRLSPHGGGADETRLAPEAPSSSSGWLGSSGSIDHGRFQPGTIFQQRYRVIGLLGRGGMGEVYRADDLRLGQPVALKFLPETLKLDAGRLAQFHNEARTARQVSHPNVCRVYDIGEAEGLLFLTMEYVDGEDLSSLLRRIGRLPEDKAVEIARQICAGLAAAHERGVIHRDLKPANIMLDGHGKVRVMDFSLAATGSVTGIAGTPAYMAPEQFAGGNVTAKSDIYALGLVLYELFTGKRAYEAKSIADLVALHSSGPVATPTSLVKNLDGAIERAILRCLDPDPAKRPASALAVAASLPGGDPLAAALAAGETPSPEMVAAAGGVSATLSAASGLVWLGATAVLLIIVAALADRTSLLARVQLTKPAAVLLDRAEELRQSFGFQDQPVDRASGFRYDRGFLNWSRRNGKGEEPWRALAQARPAAMLFWVRTSPIELAPIRPMNIADENDPPLSISGMTRITIDTKGRLVSFDWVPPEDETKAPPAKPV